MSSARAQQAGRSGQFCDLVELVRDKYAPTPRDVDVPCINLENIPEAVGRVSGWSKASENLSMKTRFEAKDILFGKLRPYLRKYAQPSFAGVCTSELLAFRAKAGVDPRYAYQVAGSLALSDYCVAASFGTKMPRTDWKTVSTFPVRIPREEEQRRIADLLSAVDEQIAIVEAEVGKRWLQLAGLQQALLSCSTLADGDVDDVLLRQLVPAVQYGISTSLEAKGAVPVLRMNNLGAGEVDVSDLKYSPRMVGPELLLKDGDVLFNRTNSMEHVGRTSIWRSQLPQATFASYLVRLFPDERRILKPYLVHLLSWEQNQTQMRRYATPGVQQVNINPTNLRRCRVRVPRSLDIQRRVVEVLDATRAYIGALNADVLKLRLQKQGLAYELLSGPKRVS